MAETDTMAAIARNRAHAEIKDFDRESGAEQKRRHGDQRRRSYESNLWIARFFSLPSDEAIGPG